MQTTIRVAYKPLASPGSAWTERTALSTFGVVYQDPSLHSSEQTVGNYVLFLAAVGRDGDGDDIWFTRSTDYDNTWAAGYMIAEITVVADDRHYATPKIRYGNSGVVSCLWEFAPYASAGLDRALRYRRAINSAATSGNWQGALNLTSNSNGEHETWGDLAASTVNGDVLVTYGRLLSNGSTNGSASMASTNLGASFGAATLMDVDDPLALVVDPAGDFHLGLDLQNNQENAAVMKLDAPLPGAWGTPLNFSDRLYHDGYQDFTADCIATDPTHAHQAAMAWYRDGASGAVDTVFFDAAWHDDAGWPNYVPGFPKALTSDPLAPPAICEVDGDDRREIVFGTADGNVRVLNHDGSSVPGWPQDVGSLPSNAAIAVGDINGDGSHEVVVGNTTGAVFAFNANGALLPGFPYQTPWNTSWTYVSLGRFGPDQRLDIVVAAGTHLIKLRSDAVRDPDLAITVAATVNGSAAIGDVDDDGDNEYVVLVAGAMNVLRPENTVQATRALAGKTFFSSPALADLNLDGDLEILAATEQGDVYVMHPDGTNLAGWPKTVSSGSELNSPIAADLSGTGEPEVFWAEQGNSGAEVHGYQMTGTALPSYPQTTGGIGLSSPIVDYMVGSPEVFLLGTVAGYSWSNLGVTNAGWPKSLMGWGSLTPASGDVDNDGLLDLVFLNYGTNRAINLIRTNATLIRTPASITRWWPMYGYNPERQFCLACSPLDQVTGVDPGERQDLRLEARPNVGSTFAFLLQLPVAAPVRLELYDIGGRRVRTLIKDELPAGARTVSWDARLDNGERATAGMYFARLSVPVAGRMQHRVERVTVLP
jgi:hypothetical protein